MANCVANLKWDKLHPHNVWVITKGADYKKYKKEPIPEEYWYRLKIVNTSFRGQIIMFSPIINIAKIH